MAEAAEKTGQTQITKNEAKTTILDDYKLAVKSREVSLIGRKEVLTGKAKFGIFGDGKEVPQIAMAKYFQNGDFRSGYYRGQTFMMAIHQLTVEGFFAQLYAHADVEAEPASAGRSMNGHYATRSMDDAGEWKDLMQMKNSSSDVSPTGSQMPRLLGLALASKFYRESKELKGKNKFSNGGNEVAFGAIGDASTSEGMFWETINAAGVLQVPMVMSVWDDGYGISVTKSYQTTKESISEALSGFQRTKDKKGLEILKVKAWNYPDLIATYEKGVKIAREEHVPVLIHVEDVTQPQGHSTSGSHERYKSKERLAWEIEYDCIKKMREWIEEKGIADAKELDEIEKAAKQEAKDGRKKAWEVFVNPIKAEINEVSPLIENLMQENELSSISEALKELKSNLAPLRKDIYEMVRATLYQTRANQSDARNALVSWLESANEQNRDRYDSDLYSQTTHSPLNIEELKPDVDASSEMVDGRVVIRENFKKIFKNNPYVVAFGEDSGKLGDVNQGFEGIQEEFGENRLFDTGIRETTIIGQAIGMALRGLRPIAEIQYLDYLLYCLQIMSDDLATMRYRTKSGQIAPAIVRTRGHRLEGIWHSGSPMAMVLNGLRGMHVCVPRTLTQAAGFYNTLLEGDDPGLIIEPLNAYRTKEPMPANLGEFKTPLGIPEIVEEGTDLTIVSYGSTCNIAVNAVEKLKEMSISAELIDCRTLLPFDRNHLIAESLEKTNRLLIVDEDVPGGASAFILNKILTEQKGYYFLDSEPVMLTAKAHRPAYGSDGDYFSKPNCEDIIEAAYGIMNEANPQGFPSIY